MILFKILIKAACLVMFSLLSSCVLLLGKSRSGIKVYYVFTSIFLWGVILLI